MASGRSHSIASLAAATCFTVTAVYSHNPDLLWAAGGAFVGLILTPDLDQNTETISDFFVKSIPDFMREIISPLEKVFNYLGLILGKVWFFYSWPYRWFFAHRSFGSHFPIFSTMIRIAYFLWPLYYFGHPLHPAFVNGLVAADFIHWTMDFRLFRRVFIQ